MSSTWSVTGVELPRYRAGRIPRCCHPHSRQRCHALGDPELYRSMPFQDMQPSGYAGSLWPLVGARPGSGRWRRSCPCSTRCGLLRTPTASLSPTSTWPCNFCAWAPLNVHVRLGPAPHRPPLRGPGPAGLVEVAVAVRGGSGISCGAWAPAYWGGGGPGRPTAGAPPPAWSRWWQWSPDRCAGTRCCCALPRTAPHREGRPRPGGRPHSGLFTVVVGSRLLWRDLLNCPRPPGPDRCLPVSAEAARRRVSAALGHGRVCPVARAAAPVCRQARTSAAAATHRGPLDGPPVDNGTTMCWFVVFVA